MGKHVHESCLYTKSHEWLLQHESDTYVMGISDHAQDSLGDITYLGLPEVGKAFKAGQVIGFVESVKAVSDIYAPVDLEVLEVNSTLEQAPETCNHDPFGKGWIAKIKVTQSEQLSELFDAKGYEAYLSEEQ